MEPWKQKANRVIGELCHAAWLKANTDKNGKRYKKHHQYAVPEDAETLLKAVKENDEVTAKALFIRLAYN
jgi:hypothetical protein